MIRTLPTSLRSKQLAKLTFGLAIASSLVWAEVAEAQLRTGRQTQREFYAAAESLDAASTDTEAMGVLAARPTPSRPTQTVATKSQPGSSQATSLQNQPRVRAGNGIAKASYVQSFADVGDDAPSLPSSHEPSRRPRRVNSKGPVSLASQQTATSTTSSIVIDDEGSNPVQLASCPMCQQGHPHSHRMAQAPIARERHNQEVSALHEGVIYDGGTSDGVLIEGESLGVDSSYAPSCEQCGMASPGCGCGSIPTLNIQLSFPYLHHLQRVSARIEAATFWQTDQNIPGLIRTGAIGTAGSSDLFGGTNGMDETVQGWRGEIGWTFGQSQCNTIQLRFFDPSSQSLTFDSNTANSPSIVRPYLDPVTNTQQSISVLEPGVSTGSSLSTASSDVFGGDLLLRRVMRRSHAGHTELMVGYQTARLTDNIDVHTRTAAIPSLNLLELRDQFHTENQFNGASLGISRSTYGPSWSLSGMFKLGLGNLERNVTISGFQSITVPSNPPATSTSTNGLLARSTNSGSYNSDTFIVSPEVNVTLGYRLTRNLEATVGYNYLGIPKVVRAADQIDPNLASNLSNPLSGPARPSFTLTEDNFSLHSLNYGLQYRY
jgi:hypothetical protein